MVPVLALSCIWAPAGCFSFPPTISGMKSKSLGFITGLDPPDPGGPKLCFPATLFPSLRISPDPLPGCCL